MKKLKANAVAFFKTLLYMIKTLKTPRAIIAFLIALGTLSGGFLIIVGQIIGRKTISGLGTAILTFWNVIPLTPLFGISFAIGVLIQRFIFLDPKALRVKEIKAIYNDAKEKYKNKTEKKEAL